MSPASLLRADVSTAARPWQPSAAAPVAVAAVLAGLAGGWASVRYADALHFRLSPMHAVALLGAVAAAVAVLRRPVLGLVALVLLVYLNLSDVLIRNHGLPSPLQLLMLPLLVAAAVEWRTKLLEGLWPWTVTAALAAYALALLASSTVAESTALADARTVAAVKDLVVYALVLLLASTPQRARAGAWALVGGGLVLSAVALVQVVTGDYANDFGGLARMEYAQVYDEVVDVRISGPLGDPNFFAQILVIVVPVAFLLGLKEGNRWLRLVAWGTAGALTATTLLTYSRGGALTLGLVGVCSLVAAHPTHKRRVLVGGLLLLGGLALARTDFARRLATLAQLRPGQEQTVEVDSSFRSRMLYAQVAWRMFLDHPVLGTGAGNYTVQYYDYANEVGSTAPEYNPGGDHYPHNLYLEVAAETGLVGLIALGTALLLILGRLHVAERAYFDAGDQLSAGLASALQIALLGYLVSSLFLHGHFQRYLWVLLGLSAALARAAPGALQAPARGAP